MFPKALAVALAIAIPMRAAQAAEPDVTVLLHGHIYTADPARPWVEAMAIRGTRIEAIGSDAEVQRQRAAHARVVDLKGRTVVPGMIDSHMHMLFGAMELRGFSLSEPASSITPDHPAALVAAIRNFAAAHPADAVLIGRADYSTVAPAMPARALLDQAVPDRPVIVHNSSEHALWVNSAALRLAGVGDEPVADPEEERNISRDASGHPTGMLLEAAQEVMERAVLARFSEPQKLALLRGAGHYLNSLGITSVVNATGDLAEIRLYAALRDAGELTVRTRTAFGAVAVPHRLTPQFLADLEAARTQYHDEWVSANLVKFFADGSTGLIPPLVYRPADYRALVLELDRRGFQLMTHAERSDSMHMVLDAYEQAIRHNGPRDRRLRIEHNFVVAAADLPRYAPLHVIASTQPMFCCSAIGSGFDDKDPTVTDRWRSMLDSGVTLALGSDWPCTWPPDPFVNIQQAVTRQVWASPDTAGVQSLPVDGAHQGGSKPTGAVYHPEERITVREAIDAYTRGAAYAAFEDDHAGTLAPGKFADLVVLSQDPFAVDPLQIANTQALLTMVGGKVVFERTPGVIASRQP